MVTTQPDSVEVAELNKAAASSDISICVVNYNGEALVGDAIRAAIGAEPSFREVVLIDNGSTDRSLELVSSQFPQVRIIALADNRGPGAARNAGFTSSLGDRVLFVDNDVLVTPHCAAELSRALDADREAVIAMPRVLYRHSPEIIQYDGAESHYLGMMSLRNQDMPVHAAPSEVTQIGSLVSACFMVDRSRWGGRGGGDLFDDSFFIYHEDHDLGLRARLTGGRILAVPHAQCLHGEGTAGLSLRSTGSYRPTRVVGTIRNRWLVLLKNYQLRTLLLLSPVLVVFELFQLAGAVKKRWHREWWRAFRHVASHWSEIRTSRSEVQGMRRVGDGLLLRGGPVPFTTQLAGARSERMAASVLDRICTSYWTTVKRWI